MPTPSAAEVSSSFSPDLVEAWNVSHKEAAKVDKVTGFLNKIGMNFSDAISGLVLKLSHFIEDASAGTAGTQTVINTVMAPLQALAESSGVAEAIEKGVNGFLEAMPTLMKALDEVAKVHPFISGMIILGILY